MHGRITRKLLRKLWDAYNTLNVQACKLQYWWSLMGAYVDSDFAIVGMT